MHHNVVGFLYFWWRCKLRVGWLRATFELNELTRRRSRPLDWCTATYWVLCNLHRRKPHGNNLLPTRSRNDNVPHANLHLEHARYWNLDSARVPSSYRRAHHALLRPSLWNSHLLGRRWWCSSSMATHFLVLGSPRGVHLGAAVLWNGFRNYSRVL